MLKPLKDRILVSYLEQEQKTAGGIIIPESAKERPQKGKVEAVGKEVEDVKKGDVIMFKTYSPDNIKMDGKEYGILKLEDVMGIIE
ncbi:MAG: co-chaperone GroES [bacterium]|nr:co-chaperone GroES [bacterium]